MQAKLLLVFLLGFLAFAAAQGTALATVDLVVTPPNGPRFQFQDRANYTVSVRPTSTTGGTPVDPTGTVQIQVDGVTTETCTLEKSICTVTEQNDISVGSRTFRAVYPGDPVYAAANSDPQVVVVFVTVVLSVTANPASITTADQPITFTASATSYPTTNDINGTVNFVRESPLPRTTVGTCSFGATPCTFTVPGNTFANGNYTILAEYLGSPTVAPATSSSIFILVGPAALTSTTTTSAASTTTSAGSDSTTTTAAGSDGTTTNAAGSDGTTTTNAAGSGSTTTNAAGQTTTTTGGKTSASTTNAGLSSTTVSGGANGDGDNGSTSTSGASSLFASATILVALFSAIML